MRQFIVASLSILTPAQGMVLAAIGLLGLVVVARSKRVGGMLAGLSVFVAGGYGFASMLVGLLWLR
jgi:hypothetical protein